MTVIAMMMANDKILLFIFGLLSTLGVTVFMYKYTHNHSKFKTNMLFFSSLNYNRLRAHFMMAFYVVYSRYSNSFHE